MKYEVSISKDSGRNRRRGGSACFAGSRPAEKKSSEDDVFRERGRGWSDLTAEQVELEEMVQTQSRGLGSHFVNHIHV